MDAFARPSLLRDRHVLGLLLLLLCFVQFLTECFGWLGVGSLKTRRTVLWNLSDIKD